MDTLYRCCAGLDVHKETVAACVRRIDSAGRIAKAVRTFGTTTQELLGLLDWMLAEGVQAAAMESTGVFWKPIWNILEGSLPLVLTNARHMRNVPGRKTDVKDCEWIAQLLQYGLLTASFVPPRSQRELRDLTRQRTQLVGEQTRAANRIHKVLEDANVKLASVASDILGLSGQAMIRAIIAGQDDPAQLAELAKGRLRDKLPQLREALRGHWTGHHRFLLGQLMDHVGFLDRQIAALSERMAQLMLPFQPAIQRLTTIPGVAQRTAENILAETGTDMSRFPSDEHLSSWAGVCPGNHQTGPKRRNVRVNQGSRWLKLALNQAAWGASHTKKTYLSAQYRRLAGRRGAKRAAMAVGHTILVMVYHMLDRNMDYQELGHDFLDKLKPERTKKYLVKRLEAMGYTVTLAPAAQPA
jgi:transposase